MTQERKDFYQISIVIKWKCSNALLSNYYLYYITYIYLLAKLIPFYTKINEMNYLIN